MKTPVVHVDGGYCALGTELAMRLDRVVEAKDAIIPNASTRWAWRSDLCSVCSRRGGVLLFNRAVAERNAYEAGEEAPRVVARREERRAADAAAAALREEKAREKEAKKKAREKRSRAAAERRAEREKKRESKLDARRAREASKASAKAAREAARAARKSVPRAPRVRPANDVQPAGAP